jgi:hypothetical protein
MQLPRLLLTPHLMGRPIGAPGDEERQLATIGAALDLLENAEANDTIAKMPGRYRPVPRED